jgi:hypothetical protein
VTTIAAPIRHVRSGTIHLWHTWNVLTDDGTEITIYHIGCGQRRRNTTGGSCRAAPDLTHTDRYAISCQKCQTITETEPTP